MNRRLSRRLIAPGLAGALAATSVVLGPAASGIEPEPLPTSPISIKSPHTMKVSSWRGRVWTDFGLRLVAGEQPFEVWSNRPSYDEPITSVWKGPEGDAELPAGSMRTFAGIDEFTHVRVVRRRGHRVVRQFETPACFNGYNSQRIHPDAPASSPYPAGCPWNPYTLGSVMGVQAGWATPLFSEWSTSMRLKPGRYRVVAEILPEWVEFFGIEGGDAVTRTRLIVSDESKAGSRERPSATGHRLARPAATEPGAEDEGEVVPEAAPDLRSLPAFDLGLNRRGTQLRFAATVWNGGGGPMVVDGFRGADEDHMDAYQYFFDTEGNQTGYQHVGEFHWHEANHHHWHFEDFAGYRLLNRSRQEVVRSKKASFCLANTDAVDYTIPAADWQPGHTDLSSDCGGQDALSLRQVLSNGSGDTYLQFRAGQAFPIRRLPDGVYFVQVLANPSGVLVEQDETNNSSLRKVRIGTNRRGERFVRVPRLGVIDESGLGF